MFSEIFIVGTIQLTKNKNYSEEPWQKKSKHPLPGK
jgi:hypothetical protein